VKLPSESETVPFDVPFSNTFTPGRAPPSSDDVTLPATVDCAKAVVAPHNRRTVRYLHTYRYNLVIIN
jgi:hypothetical protein